MCFIIYKYGQKSFKIVAVSMIGDQDKIFFNTLCVLKQVNLKCENNRDSKGIM